VPCIRTAGRSVERRAAGADCAWPRRLWVHCDADHGRAAHRRVRVHRRRRQPLAGDPPRRRRHAVSPRVGEGAGRRRSRPNRRPHTSKPRSRPSPTPPTRPPPTLKRASCSDGSPRIRRCWTTCRPGTTSTSPSLPRRRRPGDDAPKMGGESHRRRHQPGRNANASCSRPRAGRRSRLSRSSNFPAGSDRPG
jgi:hypothetical protein